jgi:hypothetical protein
MKVIYLKLKYYVRLSQLCWYFLIVCDSGIAIEVESTTIAGEDYLDSILRFF